MASALRDVENLGAIIVPVAPHMGGRWLNGYVPGVTVELSIIPSESVEAVDAEITRMREALGLSS